MPSSGIRPNQLNINKSSNRNNSKLQLHTINKSPLKAYNNYPSSFALLLLKAQARALLAQAKVREAALKAKVIDLVKKCYRISNKEVIINANIIVLKAKKATLKQSFAL